MTELHKLIVRILRGEVYRQGLTQRQLATRTGLGLNTVKRALAGQTLSADTIDRLCLTLRIDLKQRIQAYPQDRFHTEHARGVPAPPENIGAPPRSDPSPPQPGNAGTTPPTAHPPERAP